MNLHTQTTTRAMKVVVAVLCLLAVCARAQYRDWIGEEEAANSRWIPKPKYLLLDTDMTRESFDSGVGPVQYVNRFYISPRMAVGWDNYIYHPYLLTYSALFEPGYSWRRQTVNGVTTDDNEFGVNGRISAEFLSQKPYSSTFSFERGHDEVQYGFFNQASVDTQTWGVSSGYHQGGIPTQISYSDSREDSDELFQRTIADDKELTLTARNERRNHDITFFTYQYDQFDRTVETTTRSSTSDSSNHRIDMQDTENFERSTLKTTMRFNTREANQTSENDLNASANYDLDLRDDLHNYDEGNYSQYASDGFTSRNVYAAAGLRHQLYESLTSSLDLHGGWEDSDAGGQKFQSTSVGASVTEDYTKRLGNWGRLSLSDSIGVGYTHQTSSGGVTLIANESHAVQLNNRVRLTHTRALMLVSITDSNNVVLDPSDYTVIHTEPWQIQINPFGPSHINPGAQVIVTYTIANEPTANSTSFNNAVQLRLSFWNDLASVYARYSFTDNNSDSPDIVIENEDVLESGATVTWKNLTLNADYLDERSTYFNLRNFNLSESYTMNVSDESTLSVNLNQEWGVNTSKGGPNGLTLRQNNAFYNFMVSYDWRPTQRLSWKNEIGYQIQNGFNMDQDYVAARSYLNWSVGKIQLSTGYEHENVDYLHQTKLRDYVFFKLRRNF